MLHKNDKFNSIRLLLNIYAEQVFGVGPRTRQTSFTCLKTDPTRFYPDLSRKGVNYETL